MAACPCGVQLSQLMRLLFLQGCMIVALAGLTWSASAIQAAVVGEDTNLNLRDEEILIRVEGKAYCNCCVVQQGLTRFRKSFLAGVRAAVECNNESGGASYVVAQTTTDERGQFMLDFSVSVRNIDDLKNIFNGLCSVRLLHNPHTVCNSLVTGSPNLLSMESFRGNFIEYSVGELSYHPPSLLSFFSMLSRLSDTAIAALSRKACNHRQAAASISRKLLASSPHRHSESVTTESLTLGPPDPPQPAGDFPTKRTSSLGPPNPYQSRLTP
ncbi:hypothetical protein O6H91_14G005100 [Diphasiastrum complanatum]|uniref:Uncharacterized protein n=1 Tax=Diphasiastrum complanatum TaxID=34168 RepID=A0ACC2BL57_DIPCM|nr:hypothetical protein O6H91_14G005100 [Diphasiastrum complanatum]